MAKGIPVGKLDSKHLADYLGEVTVCKSQRGLRFPLYLSTRAGPVFLNTRDGQDMILDHAVMFSSENEQEAAIEATETINRDTHESTEAPADEPEAEDWLL